MEAHRSLGVIMGGRTSLMRQKNFDRCIELMYKLNINYVFTMRTNLAIYLIELTNDL